MCVSFTLIFTKTKANSVSPFIFGLAVLVLMLEARLGSSRQYVSLGEKVSVLDTVKMNEFTSYHSITQNALDH